MNTISKAPWNVVPGNGFSHEIQDAFGRLLASVVTGNGQIALNNARVMAASPYLLAACNALLGAEEEWELQGAREMARAAVMRAVSTDRFQPGEDLLKQVVYRIGEMNYEHAS